MTATDRRYRLLNPGPVTLTERVRAALQRPDLCHREQEFYDLALDVRGRIERIYEGCAGNFAAVLLTGSGTSAVEAMVGSMVPKDGHALVVANGVYGDRMAAMLTAQGKRFTVVAADWLAPMDLAGVERALAADASVTHVLAVQHETTTGRDNDVAALGAICKRFAKPMLLDGVSSFAGEPIDFDGWNLEAVAAANKCVHGVPGVSFVVARESAFTARASGATSVYLDLWKYWKDQRTGSSPFTQSVHCMYALQEALKELDDEGGWRARHATYARRASAVREVLFELGVELFLTDGATASSSILTAFRVPAWTTYDALHDGLKERGFIIYAGQGPYAGKMFRIAVMGALDERDMAELLDGLRALMRRPG